MAFAFPQVQKTAVSFFPFGLRIRRIKGVTIAPSRKPFMLWGDPHRLSIFAWWSFHNRDPPMLQPFTRWRNLSWHRCQMSRACKIYIQAHHSRGNNRKNLHIPVRWCPGWSPLSAKKPNSVWNQLDGQMQEIMVERMATSNRSTTCQSKKNMWHIINWKVAIPLELTWYEALGIFEKSSALAANAGSAKAETHPHCLDTSIFKIIDTGLGHLQKSWRVMRIYQRWFNPELMTEMSKNVSIPNRIFLI